MAYFFNDDKSKKQLYAGIEPKNTTLTLPIISSSDVAESIIKYVDMTALNLPAGVDPAAWLASKSAITLSTRILIGDGFLSGVNLKQASFSTTIFHPIEIPTVDNETKYLINNEWAVDVSDISPTKKQTLTFTLFLERLSGVLKIGYVAGLANNNRLGSTEAIGDVGFLFFNIKTLTI